MNKLRLSKTDLNKFKIWLKYLNIVNNKTSNKQLLFNYFFDKFASSPQLFYLFLEYFKKNLLEMKDKEKQKNLAEKFLDILAPLCERFNFFEEKNILCDICFQISNEQKYNELKKSFSKYEKQSKKIIEEILTKLHEALDNKNYDYELIGRFKNLYSTYKKNIRRPHYLLRMNDVFAFRIILNSNSTKECFEVLNLLHDSFYPLPDFFKDYITIPKINGYQSLHTGLTNIVENLDLPIEIQIRTREMNNFAENGIAAHWIYSQEKKSKLITEKEQKLLDYLLCIAYSSKKEKNIYCFSYKGDMIKMPEKATVLDFAYQIHTDLGNKTKSALVNNEPKPLYYRIKEGDQIKIIQSPKEQIEAKWLTYAHTKYAYKKIFDHLKHYEKKS